VALAHHVHVLDHGLLDIRQFLLVALAHHLHALDHGLLELLHAPDHGLLELIHALLMLPLLLLRTPLHLPQGLLNLVLLARNTVQCFLDLLQLGLHELHLSDRRLHALML
jgi:hypothetical protein